MAFHTLIFNMCAIQGLPALSLSLIHEHKCMSMPLMRMTALNYRLLITVVYDQNVAIEWMSEWMIGWKNKSQVLYSSVWISLHSLN